MIVSRSGVARWIGKPLAAAGLRCHELLWTGDGEATQQALARLAATLPKGTWIFWGDSAAADVPEFSALAEKLGFRGMGPSGTALVQSSNRLTLLMRAREMGIPTLLSSDVAYASAREVAGKRGVLKSIRAADRDQRGMVLSDLPEEEASVALWFEELRLRSPEPLAYLERFVEGAQLIRLLAVADFASPQRRVSARFFSPVQASLRSQGRSLVEWTEDRPELASMQRSAEFLLQNLRWKGIASFRFLVDGDRCYFLDLSAQLSHADRIAERDDGELSAALITLIKGKTLTDRPASHVPMRVRGSAQVRAENPVTSLPQPGPLWVPSGEDWQVDSQGEITTLFAEGETRASVLHALGEQLNALPVFSGLIETNEDFLRQLLHHPWVRDAGVHAEFAEEDFSPLWIPHAGLGNLDLKRIARVLADRAGLGDAWWIAGVKVDAADSAEYSDLGGGLTLRSQKGHPIWLFPGKSGAWRGRHGSHFFWARPREQGAVGVRALCSGVVLALLVREQVQQPAGQPVLLLESAGRIVPHALPRNARLLHWRVSPRQKVDAQELLAEVEILPVSQS